MTQDELLRLIDEAAADGRTTLDLSGEGLDELPPEIGKLTNLRTLVLGKWNKNKRAGYESACGNHLKILPDEIIHLKKLRSILLSYNSFQGLPKVITKLENLRSLHLNGNALSVLHEDIGRLTNLRFLNLGDNGLSTLPDSVRHMLRLRSLRLFNNGLTDIPEIVYEMTNLRLLDLRDNRLTNVSEKIEQLFKLESLMLGSSTGLDDSNNNLCALPENINQLTNLRTLDLSCNYFSKLPEAICQLASLKELDISINGLSMLPEKIGQLTNLQSLYIGVNQIRSLPESIGQLTNLRSLGVSFNQLSRLPETIDQLSKLEFFDLSYNQLSRLPETIDQLSKLEFFNLSHNQLSNLSKRTKSLKRLKVLDLRGNPLPIPPEILGDKDIFFGSPNSSEKVLDFYFSLQAEEGSIPLYEAKLILVGEGSAGKTSLAKKIDNENYELPEDEKSTEGIDVIRWDFPLPDGNTFRVNIWDFGGQEIYHATHQFFLTKRSLYFLVADTRQENTDFYYWLKIIELLSDGSPVLVIKNEKQDRQCDIDEGLFRGQFKSLETYLPTNLKENRGLDKIKQDIRHYILKLPHVGTPLPKNWVRVRSALENYSQNCNTITVEQYCDLCRQNGFTDKQQMLSLSGYLHDLGVCLHFQDDKLLKRTVILKPEWATTAIYKVADSDTVRNHKGRFTEADTEAIWADREYANLRDELLQLMMRFKLAYELPNRPGHYIAPQLLPISKPDYPWDTTDNLILRYTYDFMPKGILTRFIVETHQSIEDQNNLWKNGVVLADNWARAQVIENYPKKEINVRVSGSNKKPLLEKIRYELWKIHESYERLQYAELIPCNCQQCKSSDKPQSYPYELLMKYIGDRRYEIECRGSYEQVDVRRLIDDISYQSLRNDSGFESRQRESLSGDSYSRFRTQPQSVHNGDVYYQYGGRDNFAGDKVSGDKIDTQINNQQELTQLSNALKTLLQDLEQEYNPKTPRGQANIQREVIETICQDPTLLQRIGNVLNSNTEEALAQMIQHPLAKAILARLKELKRD